MANTMLTNNSNGLTQQIQRFSENIKKSGKTPQQLYDEVLKSGKYSQLQIENARKLAQMFLKNL